MSGQQRGTELDGQVEGEIDLGNGASPGQLFTVLYRELHRLPQRALVSDFAFAAIAGVLAMSDELNALR